VLSVLHIGDEKVKWGKQPLSISHERGNNMWQRIVRFDIVRWPQCRCGDARWRSSSSLARSFRTISV